MYMYEILEQSVFELLLNLFQQATDPLNFALSPFIWNTSRALQHYGTKHH